MLGHHTILHTLGHLSQTFTNSAQSLTKDGVAYLCFICASPGSTARIHSYKMKYHDTKVFITTIDPQIR
jgi:hypothetical protein